MAQTRGSTAVERVLGGTPVGVFVRLLVMSFVVGLILRTMDITPTQLLETVTDYLVSLTAGWREMLGGAYETLFFGAAIVIPIWLVFRALRLIGR